MRGVILLLLAATLTIWDAPPVAAPKPDAYPGNLQWDKSQVFDFGMQDLLHGWKATSEGTMVTRDGGESWEPVRAETTLPPDHMGKSAVDSAVDSRTTDFLSARYTWRKTQMVTDRIGWALLSHRNTGDAGLWLTADGGATWQQTVTADIGEVLRLEQQRLDARKREMAYFSSPLAGRERIQDDWSVFPAEAAPGDVVLVRHRGAGEIEWDGRTYPLKPFLTGFYTYVPLGMDVKPGTYSIGGATLKVIPKQFDTQYLQVTAQQQSMRRNTIRIQQDQKKINLARSKSAPEFLFPPDSAFMVPVKGRLTTPYGFTRYVNGEHAGSHRAIDLAAPEGTPVKAANDGIVVLADDLYLSGLSIYIDHGMHLFSQYIHMSKMHVKAGDRVSKGQIIGEVGTTGFSTGPHLHFTFWAHNVPVNPNPFFESTPFRWDEIR